jgi:hypothetical protein
LQQLNRGVLLLDVCQVARQVEQSFRIAEVGSGNAPNRGEAVGDAPFQQGPRRNHDVARAGDFGSSSAIAAIASAVLPTEANAIEPM